MTSELFRPVAYTSLRDPAVRQSTVRVLERAGWLVIPQPSSDHLLRTLAGVREYPWLEPSLIVVDAPESRAALIAGLRALHITVPVVLAAAPGQDAQPSDDAAVRVVERGRVGDVVAALVRRPEATRDSSVEQTA